MCIEIKGYKDSSTITKMYEDSQLSEALDFADELSKMGYKTSVETHKGVSLQEYGQAIRDTLNFELTDRERDPKLN